MSILLPSVETKEPLWYCWKGLTIKPSLEVNGGKGVFATQLIHIGTIIPIIGVPVEPTIVHPYKWDYYNLPGPIQAVVGCTNDALGLDISMMINETCSRPYNCVFDDDFVAVIKTINPGDELYVYYGDTYNRFRTNYDTSMNSFLTTKSRQQWIETVDTFSTRMNHKILHRVIHHYNNIVQQNSKKKKIKN